MSTEAPTDPVAGRAPAPHVSRRPRSLTPPIAGWIVALTLVASGGAWMARAANDGARRSLDAMEREVGDALGPGTRVMRMAEEIGAAMPRLIWAETHSARLAAAGTIARDAAEIRERSGSDRDDAIAEALSDLTATARDADALAARRIDALRTLPAARERLVALLAGLTARITDRQEALTALSRFHPATQPELRLLMEWGLHSKRLLGALLMTVDGAEGQSGVASAAEAHVAALNQTVSRLPESDFSVEAAALQADIAATVLGPDGIIARLAGLRDSARDAESLSVEGGRRSIVLTTVVADRLERTRQNHDFMAAELSRRIGIGDLRLLAIMVAAPVLAGFALLHLHLRIGARLTATVAAADRVIVEGARAFDTAGRDQIGAVNRALNHLARVIDERREAAEIAASRFELAVAAARAALWEVDLVEGRVWWSPEYRALLGYGEDGGDDAPTPEIATWEGLIHPDDRISATNALEAHLAGISGGYHAILRMRRADGLWIRVEDHGRVQRDGDGRALRLVGMTRPLNETVADQAPDGIGCGAPAP